MQSPLGQFNLPLDVIEAKMMADSFDASIKNVNIIEQTADSSNEQIKASESQAEKIARETLAVISLFPSANETPITRERTQKLESMVYVRNIGAVLSGYREFEESR